MYTVTLIPSLFPHPPSLKSSPTSLGQSSSLAKNRLPSKERMMFNYSIQIDIQQV